MAESVTVYSAERMKEIEDSSIVSAAIVDDHLIFTKFDETELDAGLIGAGPHVATAAAMAASNPILDAGRFGLTSDTLVLKVGDGINTWANLPEVDKAGKVLSSVTTTAHTDAAYGTSAVIPGLSGLVVPTLGFPVDVEVYLPAAHALVNTSSWVIILHDQANVIHGSERVAPPNFTNQYAQNVVIRKSLPAGTASKTFRVEALRTGGTGNLGVNVTVDIPAYLRYVAR
jgi:hypothetical protein